VLHLPDPTKKRVAKPEAVLAKLETTLLFDKGVLTDASMTADETAIGKALIGAVKTAVSAGLGALLNKADDAAAGTGLRPHVFKIIVNGPNVEFWGTEADQPVVVPLS
jgi:hypothetical protein